MDKVVNLLTTYGLSKTRIRVDILLAFFKSKKPLSIYDFKRLSSLKGVNESSIYRNLSRLEEATIIRAIPSSNGFQSYELLSKGKHHHHIVCGKCRMVQCLSVCNIEKELKSLASSVGFSLDAHTLELAGTCRRCRAMESADA